MLRSNRPLPTYNDGMVSIYREKDRSTPFGAKRNAISLNDMEFIVKLAFSSLSVREQDFTFAEQRGFNVTEKVKTHLVRGVEVGHKAVIGNTVFSVSYIDKTKTEMFIYLEGGAPLGDA